MATDINLLNVSPLPDNIRAIETKLRSVSVLAAVVLLILGVFAGISTLLTTSRLRALQDETVALNAQVSGQSQKEAMLVAVQSRATMTEKVLAQTPDWSDAMDVVLVLTQQRALYEMQVDETQRVFATVGASSLEDAVVMVRQIRALGADGQITSPILESLQLNDEGAVDVRVSFLMKFSP